MLFQENERRSTFTFVPDISSKSKELAMKREGSFNSSDVTLRLAEESRERQQRKLALLKKVEAEQAKTMVPPEPLRRSEMIIAKNENLG